MKKSKKAVETPKWVCFICGKGLKEGEGTFMDYWKNGEKLSVNVCDEHKEIKKV